MIAATQTPEEARKVFMYALEAEFGMAMTHWPEPNPNLAALVEEVGEVARALLQSNASEQVFMECVQVAVCAMRIAIYGDPQFKNKPYREEE